MDNVERKLLFPVWKRQTGRAEKEMCTHKFGIPQFRCQADSELMKLQYICSATIAVYRAAIE